MKRIIFILITLALNLSVSAQENEPGHNLGKTLEEMRQTVCCSTVRYLRTDHKGDLYQDGYTENGTAFFFYLKNNKVIEECMIIQTNNGLPLDFYNATVDKFIKTPYKLGSNQPYYKHFVYSTFSITIQYNSENGKNTFAIIWQEGGYNTSIN